MRPPLIVATGPGVEILRARWVQAAIRYRAIVNDQTTNELRQTERDYVFAWRRARHRMIYGRRAFPDRERPRAA